MHVYSVHRINGDPVSLITITDFDRDSFEYVGQDYFKDDTSVYYVGDKLLEAGKIESADSATFALFNPEPDVFFGIDENAIYYKSKKLEGLNPAEVQYADERIYSGDVTWEKSIFSHTDDYVLDYGDKEYTLDFVGKSVTIDIAAERYTRYDSEENEYLIWFNELAGDSGTPPFFVKEVPYSAKQLLLSGDEDLVVDFLLQNSSTFYIEFEDNILDEVTYFDSGVEITNQAYGPTARFVWFDDDSKTAILIEGGRSDDGYFYDSPRLQEIIDTVGIVIE